MNHSVRLTLAIAALSAVNATASSDVVITATRSAETTSDTLSPVTVVTKEDIQQANAADLTDLLTKTAGLSITSTGSRGSTTSVSIRGNSTQRLTVLIDGIPVGSATLGSMALNHIPLASIERIEVVRGPVSSLYGANAISGVIQIFTKDPQAVEDDSIGGYIGTTLASYRSVQVRAGGHYDSQKFGLSANVSGERTEGFDSTDLTTPYNADDDSFDELQGSIAGYVNINEKTRFNASYLQSANTIESDDINSADDIEGGSYTENSIKNFSTNIQYSANDRLRLTATAGRYWESGETTSSYLSLVESEKTQLGLIANFDVNEKNAITTGIDYSVDDVSGSDVAYDKTKRKDTGYYAQLKSNYDLIAMVASVRFDDSDSFGQHTTGGVTLSTGSMIDNAQLVVSYGTSFRAPTFNDLYWPGYGNPDLKPEEAENLEIALKGQLDTTDWRISYFQSEITNLISWGSNIGSAEINGIEAEISAYVYGVDVLINATVLDSMNADTDTHNIGLAETSAYLKIGKSLGQYDVSYDILYEADRYLTGGEDTLDNYFLVGLNGTYRPIDALSLGLRVDNLFDQDYVINTINSTYNYNTPGRVLRLSADYRF